MNANEKKWLSKNMRLILEYLEATKPPDLTTTRDILGILYPGQKIDKTKFSSVLRTLNNLQKRGLVEKVTQKTVWRSPKRPRTPDGN